MTVKGALFDFCAAYTGKSRPYPAVPRAAGYRRQAHATGPRKGPCVVRLSILAEGQSTQELQHVPAQRIGQ